MNWNERNVIKKSIEATSDAMLLVLQPREYVGWICYLFECLEAGHAPEQKDLIEMAMEKTVDALKERLERGEW